MRRSRATLLLLGLCSSIVSNAAEKTPPCLSHVLKSVSAYKDENGLRHVSVVRPEQNGTETAKIYQRTNRGLRMLKEMHYYPDELLDVAALKNKRVLDLGTGDGQFADDLRAAGVQAEGLDIHLSAEQKASPHFFERDAAHTGLKSETYDVIYSNVSVFAYERNNPVLMKSLLAEAGRILKPGGRLRISPTSAAQVKALLQEIPSLKLASESGGTWKWQEYVELEKVSDLRSLDTTSENWDRAYTQHGKSRYYYGKRLTDYDNETLSTRIDQVQLREGENVTGRDYAEIKKRLGLEESEVVSAHGERWLSVGEGESDFIVQANKRGIKGVAVDSRVYHPEGKAHTVQAFAQNLPFEDQHFDQVVSVWLIQHFFRPTAGSSMFNPEAGRKAILEMLRVVKVGGEVRINPVMNDGTPMIDYLDHLKELKFIDYEMLPDTKVVSSPYLQLQDGTLADTRSLKGNGSDQYRYVKIRRLR